MDQITCDQAISLDGKSKVKSKILDLSNRLFPIKKKKKKKKKRCCFRNLITFKFGFKCTMMHFCIKIKLVCFFFFFPNNITNIYKKKKKKKSNQLKGHPWTSKQYFFVRFTMGNFKIFFPTEVLPVKPIFLHEYIINATVYN